MSRRNQPIENRDFSGDGRLLVCGLDATLCLRFDSLFGRYLSSVAVYTFTGDPSAMHAESG